MKEMQTFTSVEVVKKTRKKLTRMERGLEEAIKDFQNSHQDTDDYMSLFQTVNQVTTQGSGLMWSQVREILDRNPR